MVSIFTDASFNKIDGPTIGCIVYVDGDVVHSNAYCVDAISSLHAEYQSICYACNYIIGLAEKFMNTSIILNTDCKVLADRVLQPTKQPHHVDDTKIDTWILKLKQLSGELRRITNSSFSINWIPRTQNKAADSLARIISRQRKEIISSVHLPLLSMYRNTCSNVGDNVKHHLRYVTGKSRYVDMSIDELLRVKRSLH